MSEKTRIVDLLRQEWRCIETLLAHLPDDAWSVPALPGWDVHDVVAHLVGTERMLSGDRLPKVPAGQVDKAHVRNEIARTNEAWVVDLRQRTHAQLLEDFRSVTTARLAALDAMDDEAFDAPSWTPVGDATYGRFMEVRVFDTWMHEQDIRDAVGVPGHDAGPVAEQSVNEVVTALGYVVGKKAAVPSGSTVTFELDGPVHRSIHVEVGERAAVVPSISAPATVVLTLSSSLFMRMAGGRVDPESVLGSVRIAGNDLLGRRVATSLAYTI